MRSTGPLLSFASSLTPRAMSLQLKRNALLLDKLVATKESRYAVRALRQVRGWQGQSPANLSVRPAVEN